MRSVQWQLDTINRSNISLRMSYFGLSIIAFQCMNYLVEMLFVNGYRYINSVVYEVMALSMILLIINIVTQYFADEKYRYLLILTGIFYNYVVFRWDAFLFNEGIMSVSNVLLFPVYIGVLDYQFQKRIMYQRAYFFRSVRYSFLLGILIILSGISVLFFAPLL